ncbi:hypothetical protein ACFWBI_19315 [Streptomyces sp. NPDC059982]|uniref:hypothetical protein n=1 Tax=unclassified Streptomyces TaxID=2593676 RepID=UPI0036C95F94
MARTAAGTDDPRPTVRACAGVRRAGPPNGPARGPPWLRSGSALAGLVPSPSALVVRLGAVALGRTPFGALLVVGYGLGMAATLTAAGLLLVRLRERIETHHRIRALRGNALLRAVARTGPAATALLVILVILGLTLRAGSGAG